ncbi:hypothetical protein HPB52_016778 [Rhipicephalus sanguineus]|uniref:Uncharacterized protein n=1 Tax=Rhipicephalus sanguineus TaxID=34632 RepID=A0A9D4SN23_RHISA|nr:hypothetical protein HPB52_016778 [Rhipicephalus sanguineus]
MESSHATSDMRALWKNGVRHLGVLDFIPGADTTEAAVERLFKLLQLCRQLLDNVIPNTALPKASLALGMTFMSSNKRQVYANVEKHLRSGWSPSRHKIDLVVLRTHLSGRDDTDPSCTVTGSSVWGRTLADYQPSMIDTLDYVEKKLKPLSSQSLFFVSMSAAVRRYVPIGQDNKAKSFGLGTRCKAYDESDYAREVDNFALVCGDKEYAAHIVRDEAHETMHSFRLSPRSAVTFDSEDTIFAKMCKARKMVASVPYGLALFDAEFDDTSNECSSRNKFGNFTLVRAARRAVDYVYGRPSQDGDGKKTRPPRSKPSAGATGSRIPVWISKRDLHDASSSSGTSSEQSPDKRPSFILERDWLEAGSSSGVVKRSPVKRLAPGTRPAKVARMRERTPAVTAVVSGIPRRRRSSDDLSRQSKALAQLSISDIDSEDESARADADDMEVDPTSRSNPGQQSAEDSSS